MSSMAKKPKRHRHVDKQAACEHATSAAEQKIRAAGFGDLLTHDDGIYVSVYTNAELREMGQPIGKWIGQYEKGSLENSPLGITIAINVDDHKDADEMESTLLHEAGHALWELLDDSGRAEYESVAAEHDHGAEEAFADDFMYRCLGTTHLMRYRECFDSITRVD